MTRFWITPQLAQTVIAAMQDGRSEATCSLNLGLSTCHVRLGSHGASLSDDANLSLAQLDEVAGAKRGVFIFEDGRLEPVQISADYFYKLIPTDEAPTDETPTVEISGIQMHRTTGTAPFLNAMNSAKAVVRKGATVLDTCGGLGYTAIAAARLGAGSVVSLDVDVNVREIARRDPWSAEYFASPVIELVHADAADFAAQQPDDTFDCIIHDPPRFSRAGNLYGAEFYGQLARVLRPRGRLFHYTGDPFSKSRGKSFVQGVVRRLGDAGFEPRRADHLQGVLAQLR